jgi:hypothetical protein
MFNTEGKRIVTLRALMRLLPERRAVVGGEIMSTAETCSP